MEKVNHGDRVVCKGRKGHVCCNSGSDQTCVVEYDGKPPTHSPWISWDQVQPEVKEEAA